MLSRVAERLAGLRIVLASASPRRRELLQRLLPSGVEFEVIPSTFAEDLDKGQFEDAAQYVEATCRRKAEDVFERLVANEQEQQGKEQEGRATDVLVISADTVVVSPAGQIMEKPRDDAHAAEMLRTLSGVTHQVFTGVTFMQQRTTHVFSECTRVRFSELDEESIAAYVATGEPSDKAGAYGIQGFAASLVEGIEGCYSNVVGLPLNRLSRELITILTERDEAETHV